MSNLTSNLTGGGGGAGFVLFTQADNNSGIYADDAARDVYFASVPADLARLDADEFLIIKILDNGVGEIAYQQRSQGVFVDVTSLVQGETGPAGATGNSFFFKNKAARDQFFNTVGNETLLETGLPVVVNEGNAVTTFVWTGVDSPSTYDPDLFVEQALNSGPGTLFLGIDGTNLSSAGKTVNFSSAYGDTALALGNFFNENGSVKPVEFRFEKEQIFITADVFDTQLAAPQDFTFTATVSSYTQGFFIRPATAGTLTVKGYAGIDNTFPIILDQQFTMEVVDIGNVVEILFPNGLLATPLDVQFLEFDGVDLFGGLQTSGLFSGQTKPFLQTKFHIILPTHLLNEEDLDQFVLLNHDHTDASPKNGGISVVSLPTATADTFTDATFISGIDTISNPTVTTDGSATFAADDIILVNHGTDLLDSDINDTLYEVLSHVGTTLTIKGIGLNQTTIDFVRDQFIFAESTGTITKVSVSVLRLTNFGIEHSVGDSTPFTFKELAHAEDVPIIATEEFASTNARFFGELGLPGGQGWTDTTNLTGTIALFSDTVFGVDKDVIRYDIPLSSDSAKSELALSAADWLNILQFGASYSGVCRITKDINTQSIFSGMGFSPVNDPRPSSIESRVGVFISVNATHTTIRLDGQSTIVLDGLSGRPLVLKDEWFSWEIFVDPTPDAGVNFGVATMFVNGNLLVVGGIIASNNAVSDEISVANSSSTGATTFYFDSFGVTIYEEFSVKTLSTDSMAANIIQIFIPEGKRDYTVTLPDGNPRNLGDRLDFILKNVGGKLKVRTESLVVPQSIFNGLKEIDKKIIAVGGISLINTVENNNIYVEDTEILNQDPLGSAPGSINYDPLKGTMNVRNIFPGSSIQVGQESVVFVVNNTGVTITDGKVVNVAGYDSVNDAIEVALAIADSVENTEVLGITTTTMVNGAVGLVTVFGRVNDLDTTSFTEGEDVFLSDTIAGELTATKPSIPIQMGHVGKVDASTGFIQVEIKEMEKSIFGGFSHSLDQSFTAGISKPIAFNTNEEFSGIEHSETVDNSEFTLISGGVYLPTVEPQYTRTTGGGTDVLNVFVAKDTGSGFVNVPRTNVKFGVNTAGVQNVSPLTTSFRANPGDKIQFMAQVESSNLKLDAFPTTGVAPNDIPATPSVIMNIIRIGD